MQDLHIKKIVILFVLVFSVINIVTADDPFGETKIQASDKQEYDYFGYSISLSSDGSIAIIGAWGEDTGYVYEIDYSGAAYIFTRSGSTWTEQQKIQASDKGKFDHFGISVSISSDGNTAIIGSSGESTGGD